MLCPSPTCRHVNPDDARFCQACGSALGSRGVSSGGGSSRGASSRGASSRGGGSAPGDVDVTRVSSSSRLAAQGSGAASELYEVLGELGKGGMGVVYRVRNRRLGREQALKRVRCDDDELERRFLRETQALMNLEHDNIVAILDWGRDVEGPWYVMPLHAAGTLDEKIARDGALSDRDLFDLARGLARGLERAHAQGVLHRDVKPSNVLMSDGGQPKLADFGLARLEEGHADPALAGLSMTGVGMGTRLYAAPEQLDGRGADQRSDIYGLGVTLYVAATGSPPSPMREQSIPSRWRPLILRCVSLDPDQRFQDAAELLVAIEAVGLAATPVPAAPSADAVRDPLACGSCGGANVLEDRFCRTCGKSLVAGCPRCGAEYRVGAAHCGSCGLSVEAWDRARRLLDEAEQQAELGAVDAARKAAQQALEAAPGERRGRDLLARLDDRLARADRFRGQARTADEDGDLEFGLAQWQRVAELLPLDGEARERIGRQATLLRNREVREAVAAVSAALGAGAIEDGWADVAVLREPAQRAPKLAKLVERADAARRQRLRAAGSEARTALKTGLLGNAARAVEILAALDAPADLLGPLRDELLELRDGTVRALDRQRRIRQIAIGAALLLVCAVVVTLVVRSTSARAAVDELRRTLAAADLGAAREALSGVAEERSEHAAAERVLQVAERRGDAGAADLAAAITALRTVVGPRSELGRALETELLRRLGMQGDALIVGGSLALQLDGVAALRWTGGERLAATAGGFAIGPFVGEQQGAVPMPASLELAGGTSIDLELPLRVRAAHATLAPVAGACAETVGRGGRFELVARLDNFRHDEAFRVRCALDGPGADTIAFEPQSVGPHDGRELRFAALAPRAGRLHWRIDAGDESGLNELSCAGELVVTERDDPTVAIVAPVIADPDGPAVKVPRRFELAGRVGGHDRWADFATVRVVVGADQASARELRVDPRDGSFRTELSVPEDGERREVAIWFANSVRASARVFARQGVGWEAPAELFVPRERGDCPVTVTVDDGLATLDAELADGRSLAAERGVGRGEALVTLDLAPLRDVDGTIAPGLSGVDVILRARDGSGAEDTRQLRLQFDDDTPRVARFTRAVRRDGDLRTVLELSEPLRTLRLTVDGRSVDLAAENVSDAEWSETLRVPLRPEARRQRVGVEAIDRAGRTLGWAEDVEIYDVVDALGGSTPKLARFTADGDAIWAVVEDRVLRWEAGSGGATQQIAAALAVHELVCDGAGGAVVRLADGGLRRLRPGAEPEEFGQVDSEGPRLAVGRDGRVFTVKARLVSAFRGTDLRSTQPTRTLPPGNFEPGFGDTWAFTGAVRGVLRPFFAVVESRATKIIADRQLFAMFAAGRADGGTAEDWTVKSLHAPSGLLDGGDRSTASAARFADGSGVAVLAIGFSDGTVLARELFVTDGEPPAPLASQGTLRILAEGSDASTSAPVTALACRGRLVAAGDAAGVVRLLEFDGAGAMRVVRSYAPGGGEVLALALTERGGFRCALADGTIRSIDE
ncbi:MAG: protein kinase [Planctomycetes bacterium]|nr:protein kinase [Planctomycetota bacterium]